MDRYLRPFIEKDLSKKMVFLGGPRQVGKTTLALSILRGDEKHPGYINYDFPPNRSSLIKGLLPSNESLIILDEIHKYKNWRNLVKGIYDKNKGHLKILVTGSAKLDYYRRGGDSLLGRYYFYRLHPLSLYELSPDPTLVDLKNLLEFGGFPEPFLAKDSHEWKRWHQQRNTRVIRDDLQGLEQVKDISQLELLASLLPDKIGSILSINSLREDLSVSFEAADRWIKILENLYFCFRIAPFVGSKKIKAVKKEKKLYLWDWSQCINKGARLENLVASNLLKYCHFYEDTTGDKFQLQFLRDKEKREIDFLIIKNDKPLFAVECKSGMDEINPNLKYFSERTNIPTFYQIHLGEKDMINSKYRTRILPLLTFCREILKV